MDELAILPLLASKIKIRGGNPTSPGGAHAHNDEGEQNIGEEENVEDAELSSDEEGDSCEFYKFFPQFNWVVRDLSMDFQHLTPKTYLQ